MAKLGFIRLPYYPQLNVLFDDKVSSFVLSILLFWNERDANSLFIREMHTYQIKEHTFFNLDNINKALDNLIAKNFLDVKKISKAELKILKKGPKATVTDKDKEIFFTTLKVNIRVLQKELSKKGMCISKKQLHHSADDEFDFYDIIREEALPSVQILHGKISDELFTKSAYYVAKIATDIVARDDDFSFKVFAPGWRMLLQPPATAHDIVRRYLASEQKAIDLSLADGNIFIASGNEYGTLKHIINHRKKDDDTKVVAAAIFLSVKSLSDDISYTSDLSLDILKRAVALCKESLDIDLYLDDKFIKDKDLDESEEASLRTELSSFIKIK